MYGNVQVACEQVACEQVAGTIEGLRTTIARIERAGRARASTRPGGKAEAEAAEGLRFGVPAIDRHLPEGALLPGLHEFAGRGRDLAAATAPALLAANLLARSADPDAPVLWAVERRDLFMPGLAATGLAPDRVLLVEAGRDVLGVMEEAARTEGLAGVVGEIGGRLTLTASRRLQLAAEEAGLPVLAIRRPQVAAPPGTVSPVDAPNAAATRWRIAILPSRPVDPIEAGPFSLTVARALWRLELVRARNAAPASWIVEAFDETGRLAVPATPADRPDAPPWQRAVWEAGDLVA